MANPDYIPLEDKIMRFFGEVPLFSTTDVKKKFPDIHERTIYRAIDKLVKTQRIRNLHKVGPAKVYTTSGVSNLPMIRSATGDIFPVSKLLPLMSDMHEENGRFKGFDDANLMLITIMQLFVIAQDDDKKEMHRNFLIAHQRLINIKMLLQRYIDNIDAVLKHPGMSGDSSAFKRTFDNAKDPDMPKPEELLKFRTWLAKVQQARRDQSQSNEEL